MPKGRKERGIGQRAMRGQEARVARDRADYQASLNQAAKDFIGLNPELDCNDPENLKKAWKNFSEDFLPDYFPSQKSEKFVFTPTLGTSGSRASRTFLLVLVAAGMVTAVNAEIFQESLGGALTSGDKTDGDAVPTSQAVARAAGASHGNLRGDKIAVDAPPPPPSHPQPAARELAAVITLDQLASYVNSQRDPANPDKIISLTPLTATFRTDPRSGRLALPSNIGGSSAAKLPLQNVDWSAAAVAQTVFKNVDVSNGIMSNQDFRAAGSGLGGVVFENSIVDKTNFGSVIGGVTFRGEISAKNAKFDGAQGLRLKVERGNNAVATADFTGSTFEGAALNGVVVTPTQANPTDPHHVTVSGLNLVGSAVTVPTDAKGGTEVVAATSPLVAEGVVANAAVPGAALQTGSTDRPITVKLQSNATECSADGSTSSAISTVTLEEFAKTLNEQFSGHNIVVTTGDSEAGASGVKSKINLCEGQVSSAASNAKLFPQLKTQITYDQDLSPADASIEVTEAVLRAVGMTPDASLIKDQVYGMFMPSPINLDAPTQDLGYLPVMSHEYLQALAGKNPALAGCTMSVGLNPGEFKIVAGNVEMVVDPKICSKGNEFGYNCRFNQKVGAYDTRTGIALTYDLGVSLNTIEKDEKVVGYTIAVDGMRQVSGAVTEDEMRCPTPPTPTKPIGAPELGTIGIAAMSLVGVIIAYCICANNTHRCKRSAGTEARVEEAESGIELTLVEEWETGARKTSQIMIPPAGAPALSGRVSTTNPLTPPSITERVRSMTGSANPSTAVVNPHAGGTEVPVGTAPTTTRNAA